MEEGIVKYHPKPLIPSEKVVSTMMGGFGGTLASVALLVGLGASSFDQDIGGWNVSSVTDMSYMFRIATSFDQDLSGWNVANVTNMTAMFNGVTLSVANYNALLIGWDALELSNNVTFDGGNSQYSAMSLTSKRSAVMRRLLGT